VEYQKMSHLTKSEIKSIAQLVEAADMLLTLTNSHDSASLLLIQGLRLLFGVLLDEQEIINCSIQWQKDNLITVQQAKTIKALLAAK
jgi:hypothetical protein